MRSANPFGAPLQGLRLYQALLGLIQAAGLAGGLIVSRKPLAGRVVQKRLLLMRKNKTPTVIVGMRSGNSKLQNKGRSLKNEVAETV